MPSRCLGVWVQLEHYPQVFQRILLQYSAVELLAAMTPLSSLIITFHYHRSVCASVRAQDFQIIRVQKHGPEVEYHHKLTTQVEVKWLWLTLVHEVLSGSPHSSESCSGLCLSSCALAGCKFT